MIKILLSATCFALLLSGCTRETGRPQGVANSEATDHKPAEEQLLKVPTWRLSRKNWAPSFTAAGTVEKASTLTLTAVVQGLVLESYYKPGDQLGYGDVLMRIADQQMADSASKLEGLRNEVLEQFNSQLAVKENVQDFERARLALQQADKQYRRAVSELFNSDVMSVVSGIVQSAVPTDERISYRDQLATVQVDSLVVEVSTDQLLDDLAWIGRECRVRSAGAPGREIEGNILSVSFDNKSKKSTVVVVLRDSANDILKVGMPARARCSGDWLGNTVVLPRKALVEAVNGDYVYVLDQGNVAARWPALGEGDAENLPVIAGLAAGEEVIVGKLHMLEPGMSVEVLEWVTVGVKGDF